MVLQVLTASGRELRVSERAGTGGGGGVGGRGGELTVRGFNPHVFDWPTVCEGMCLLRLLFISQVG